MLCVRDMARGGCTLPPRAGQTQLKLILPVFSLVAPWRAGRRTVQPAGTCQGPQVKWEDAVARDSFTAAAMLRQSQHPRALVPCPGTAFVSSLLSEHSTGFCPESPPAPCQDGLLVALCSFRDLLCFCIPLIKDEPVPQPPGSIACVEAWGR